jgi:hypothetical protein
MEFFYVIKTGAIPYKYPLNANKKAVSLYLTTYYTAEGI